MGCLLDLLQWVKDSDVRGKRTILFPLMLIIGCAYQGAGLTTVMGSTCASATTFDGFYQCTNQYWYYPVSAQGYGNVADVQLFQSRMRLLSLSVANGRLSDAEAIADARYLAYQLKAKEQGLIAARNQQLMNALQNVASQPANGASSISAPSLTKGRFVRSYISGANRICVYTNGISETVSTIPAASICPL